MSIALVFVRSLVFALIEVALTVIFGIVALLSFALPPHTRYRIITLWTHSVLWLLAHICGLRFRVLGREHIPACRRTETAEQRLNRRSLWPCILLGQLRYSWGLLISF